MSLCYNTSERDKKFIEWIKEENRKQAIKHAKALHDFCRDTDCRQCPFGKPSEFTDRTICKITDYEEPPCGWDLEEE